MSDRHLCPVVEGLDMDVIGCWVRGITVDWQELMTISEGGCRHRRVRH